MLSVNFGVVLVAAVVSFIIGFLMHGPLLGGLWMKLADIHPTGKEKLSDMYGQMFKNLVANIISAYALSVFIMILSTSSYSLGGLMNGVFSALLVWFGFIVSGTSMEVIWMGRKSSLWLFECFATLCVYLSMGLIIAKWG